MRSSGNYATAEEYPWDQHENGEPVILPDTGAKDGLCGDRWAIHAGHWAIARGHKPYADRLPERRVVSGWAMARSMQMSE